MCVLYILKMHACHTLCIYIYICMYLCICNVFSFLTLTDTEGALHPVQPCIFGCGRHQLVCPRPSDSFDRYQGGACIRRGLRGAAPIARRNLALESSLICFVNFWGVGVTCHSDQVVFSSSGGMDLLKKLQGDLCTSGRVFVG